MPCHHLSVNATAAAGPLIWTCGALETPKMQLIPCRRRWEMVHSLRVAWRACVGNFRIRMGDVSHAGTHHHGAWILGI
jgi:hypothetical protein